MILEEKHASCYIILSDQILMSNVWLPLPREIVGNMCIAILC